MPHQAEPESILQETSHRPWPLPEAPWIMRQSWYDLLFAHWPVPLATVRPLVPAALPLDSWEGQAWVGLVPFAVRDLRARGLPGVPGATDFLELNVRTYVTVAEKPGVYFFSLDAGSALAVLGARTLFRLRYFEAELHREATSAGTHYRARRLTDRRADLDCHYRPTGPASQAVPGTLDWFLTERYCLYTAASGGRISRVNIHHRPWPLQPAEAEFSRIGVVRAVGIDLPAAPPLLHYSAEQHVLVWAPEQA